MTSLLDIAARSAWARRGTLALVAASIALGTLLLWTIERARTDLRESFSQSVSGTDLIVGARTGSIQLMLYAVFRVGGATNNVRMDSLQRIAEHRAVAWLVPLALGDSHRGFAVLGTSTAYFERFRYGDAQPLALAQGRPFAPHPAGLYEAVIGAEVARALGYAPGQRITLTHGTVSTPGIASTEHADKPFTVVGILERTGTPVDRTVHVSLEAITAIHVDWMAGAPLPGSKVSAEQAAAMDLTPKTATAALVGLKNRVAVFAVQRAVNEYDGEPLMAVLPGVALDELWNVIGVGEGALIGMSALVALVSLAGLVAVVLAGLNERRRELAVLRAVGAGPRHVLALLAAEALLVTIAGALVGAVASLGLVAALAPWIQARFGVTLQLAAPTLTQWLALAGVIGAGLIAGLVPGWRAYRLSLADGLSPRA